MKKTIQITLKLLTVFLISNMIIVLQLMYSFKSVLEIVNFENVIDIINKFGLIISIPTTIFFVLIDIFLLKKIRKNSILYIIRCFLLFTLLYLFKLIFAFYLIGSTLELLYDNSF